MIKLACFLILTLLTACATPGSNTAAHTDAALTGAWSVKKAELSGKDFPVPASFEFTVAGNDYRAGTPFNNDRGTLVFFGDVPSAAGARLDVIGDVFGNPTPIKGRRIQAIYRYPAADKREVEICFDLSERSRPTAFATRAGTELLCMIYGKK
jgi:uncharacterized protein (TIGR03067 family)